MQYIYTSCELPSNGKFYPIREVHLRPKTIFDIKALLSNPFFNLKNEIDALQACIDPRDKVDVYDLVNQDVVYLLYRLRSLSDDVLQVKYKDNVYPLYISQLDVKTLENWEHTFKLPVTGVEFELAPVPIRNVFELPQMVADFKEKYPDYAGDIPNTVSILNAIAAFDGSVNKDFIRGKLEELPWKDSLFLIDKIEKQGNMSFGVVEEGVIEVPSEEHEGEMEKVIIPITLNEQFFRPSL